MKKFQFKFQALEKVRKAREDEFMRALSAAQRKLVAAQEHKRELVVARERGLVRREELGRTPTSSVDVALENTFIQGQTQRILGADVAIQRAKRAVEKALRNFLQARRATRAIELLREKQFSEFKQARSKYEQKQMDDMVTMRHRLSESAKESA